jgi:phospholipase/carboxylesterase
LLPALTVRCRVLPALTVWRRLLPALTVRCRLLPAAAAAVAIGVGLLLADAAWAEELSRDETSGLQYLEVVTGGGAAADPLPLVVAMHGLGDRPESFRLLLDDLPAKARVVFPRGPMPHGADGFSWFDFHADDDQGAQELADGVRAAAGRVAQLLDALVKKKGGPARAVVCGFSQGAMISFALAAEHPDLVAAAIPVSGYLPPSLWPPERPKVRPLPKALALHGEADRLIPLESARWSVEALRSNGYDTALRSWPGVGHALSPEMRATLVASVVSAVEELSLPGTVLNGPPAPAPRPAVPLPPQPELGPAPPQPELRHAPPQEPAVAVP